MAPKFTKEVVLPNTDPASPFYTNLPPANTRPVDELVLFFKQWKHFVKALLIYLKEVAATKEFNASINYQLISAISFPGLEDLPKKVNQWIQDSRSSPTSTPRHEVKRTLLSSALDSMSANNASTSSLSTTQTGPTTSSSTTGNESKRPPLFSTKSNSSFLKIGLKRDSMNASTQLLGKPKTLSNPTSPSLRPVSHKRDNISISSLTSLNSHLNGDSTPEKMCKIMDPLSSVELNSFASFFPPESMFSNLPTVLLKYHLNAYGANMKSHRDLTTKMIPKLELLLKTVSLKIKELKSYVKNDAFANAEVLKEISKTGKILAEFTSAVERYSGPVPVVKGKYSASMASLTAKMKESNKTTESLADEEENTEEPSSAPENDEEGVSDDPFLIKMQLDHQLKYQLLQENYKFASYMNLQNIAKDIFAYMHKELCALLTRLGKLTSNEYAFGDDPVGGLYLMLKEKVMGSANEEFEHFAINNSAFINFYRDVGPNLRKENRVFSKVKIPYHDSIHSKCLRFGPLYKKSKIMKNYSCHYFLLTCNYLHEFKLDMTSGSDSSNGAKQGSHGQKKTKLKTFIGPDDIPVKSYNLNEYSIKPRSDDAKGFKFVLCKRSNMSRKSTFKCLDENEFEGWYNDLHELLKFGSKHMERFALVQEKLEARDMDLKLKKNKKNPANLHLDLVNQPMNVPITPNLSPTTSHTQLYDGGRNLGDELSSSSLTVGHDEALSGIFTPKVISPKLTQEFPFNQNANFSIESNHSLFSTGSSQQETPALTPPIADAYRNLDEEQLLRLQELQLLRERISELQRQRMLSEERDSQSHTGYSSSSSLLDKGSRGNLQGLDRNTLLALANSRPSSPEFYINGYNMNNHGSQSALQSGALQSRQENIGHMDSSPESSNASNPSDSVQGPNTQGNVLKVLVSDH